MLVPLSDALFVHGCSMRHVLDQGFASDHGARRWAPQGPDMVGACAQGRCVVRISGVLLLRGLLEQGQDL